MKTLSLCGGIGVLAFVLAGYQAGLFSDLPPVAASDVDEEEEQPAPKPVKARFPQDLAPAARAEPVPQADHYDPSAKFHHIAILKTTGALYEDWQEKIKEEWQADAVEKTSLVIVVGPHKKTFLELIPSPNGAPPI